MSTACAHGLELSAGGPFPACDGVLVYFGWPQAHEDDAERAVRAGLGLVAAVGALKSHAGLQTRVGIATGLVVVGDLIGSGGSQEQAIVGETPNLAARLQGVAEPNSVVIAESTRNWASIVCMLGSSREGVPPRGIAYQNITRPDRCNDRRPPKSRCRIHGRAQTQIAT